MRSLLLTDFPSGSSINYYDGKLFLVGDDANDILILDTDYKKIDSIKIFDFPEKRIPKDEKTDLEASAIVKVDGADHLIVFGSGSRKIRRKIIMIPLENNDAIPQPRFKFIETKSFVKRIEKEIEEVNIEGATVIGNNIVLSNRGNRKNPANHLIVTNEDFYKHQTEASIFIIELVLSEKHLSVSEIYFEKSRDLLFLTFSSEATNNAFDDGAIGDSCLGWITDISHKITKQRLVPDGMICLSDVNKEFKNEKIEGVCVERSDTSGMLMNLISDNDQGDSKLFKMKMTFNFPAA